MEIIPVRLTPRGEELESEAERKRERGEREERKEESLKEKQKKEMVEKKEKGRAGATTG